MKNFKGKIALFVSCGVAMFFAVTGLVMWLWNLLLPEILGVKAIGFWQAMGILILSKILFGGFGGRAKGWKGKEKLKQWKENHCTTMSDEEKERLKNLWKKRCEQGGFFGKGN